MEQLGLDFHDPACTMAQRTRDRLELLRLVLRPLPASRSSQSGELIAVNTSAPGERVWNVVHKTDVRVLLNLTATR